MTFLTLRSPASNAALVSVSHLRTNAMLGAASNKGGAGASTFLYGTDIARCRGLLVLIALACLVAGCAAVPTSAAVSVGAAAASAVERNAGKYQTAPAVIPQQHPVQENRGYVAPGQYPLAARPNWIAQPIPGLAPTETKNGVPPGQGIAPKGTQREVSIDLKFKGLRDPLELRWKDPLESPLGRANERAPLPTAQ